ncbi:MAG: hypothetical protein ABI625_04770 [bacterium]
MSLNGISSGYARPLPSSQSLPATVNDKGVRPHDTRSVAPSANTPALRAPAGTSAAALALPAEAPAGTDPALWSILSTEERSYFAKAQAMGPLTYGRRIAEHAATSSALPPVRGGRLDIRG